MFRKLIVAGFVAGFVLGFVACSSNDPATGGGGSGACADKVMKKRFTPSCKGLRQISYEREGGYEFDIAPSDDASFTLSNIHIGSHTQPDVVLTSASDPTLYADVSAIFDPSSELIDETVTKSSNCVGDDFHPRLSVTDSCGNKKTIRAEVVNKGQTVNLWDFENYLFQQGS